MTNYGLIEPFNCDDPVFCFGVEWEMFRQKLLNSAQGFTEMIHRENADRISMMCERHNRFCEVQPCPIVDGFTESHFEEWRTIVVGDSTE